MICLSRQYMPFADGRSFREQIRKKVLAHGIEAASAGAANWYIGKPPHEGARKMLTENPMKHTGIRMRQVETNDLTRFDYIIAIDEQNLQGLKQLGPAGGYVGSLSDFVPDSDWRDVPDPYFTGNFQEVYDLVTDGCRRLLAYIRKERGI